MKNILFCIITVVFCLSFRPAYAQEEISTPILTTVTNFRDLAGISAGNGGTGFANTTSNNGVMRTGVFYRSDALIRNGPNSISNTDWATISSLNIGRDIDLRAPSEIIQRPIGLRLGPLTPTLISMALRMRRPRRHGPSSLLRWPGI